MLDAFSTIASGRKLLVLVHEQKARLSDRPARVLFAEDTVVNAIAAVATIISSPLSKMIFNTYMTVNKPRYPIRVFTSEAKTIDWLKGFAG
ncbi:MAG: hypothetical protein ACFFD4_15280 [Candidatus Odinarchaeota archaeon]